MVSHDGRQVAVHGAYRAVWIFDIDAAQYLGKIYLESNGELKAPPRWSPDDLKLMIEARDQGSVAVHTEIWTLDEEQLE